MVSRIVSLVGEVKMTLFSPGTRGMQVTVQIMPIELVRKVN